ncbi:hypothetical protein ABPG77_011148 [Micractinium sp. CCAP 211/92]
MSQRQHQFAEAGDEKVEVVEKEVMDAVYRKEETPQLKQLQQQQQPSTHMLAASEQRIDDTSAQPALPWPPAAEAGPRSGAATNIHAASNCGFASLPDPQQAEHATQQGQHPMPPQAWQPAEQAQQDLCGLLLQAARSAEAAAAGLTPELAASFIMLMHTLPPGERAEKEALLRTLLAHRLHAAAAQAMTTALALRFGHAPAGPP